MNNGKAQPTYMRQRFLLSYLHQLDRSVSTVELQELMHLEMIKHNANYYEFIPYRNGTYSFQLARDMDTLGRNGYIDSISDLFNKERDGYPYPILDDCAQVERLGDDRQNLVQSGRILFTIGYEGLSVEAFTNALLKNDVRLLCDVRKNPLSRKYGFSKSLLEHIMGTVGIEYIHFPDLGIESSRRSSLETQEDYKSLFVNYTKTLGCMSQLLKWYNMAPAQNPMHFRRHDTRDPVAFRDNMRKNS